MAVAPPPVQSDLLAGRLMGRSWLNWLQSILRKLNRAPEEIGTVAVTTQAATIATTVIPTSTLTASRYQVTTYVRVTQAATVSSSLTLTLGWTDGGVSCTQAFAALTGNTTGTLQSDSIMLQADAATTITYAAAYASTGATVMQFALALVVEQRP